MALSSDGIQLNVTNNSHSEIIEVKGPNVTIVRKYYCMISALVVGQNIHPNRNSLTVNNNQISHQIATLNVFSIDVILMYFGLTRLFCVLTVFL